MKWDWGEWGSVRNTTGIRWTDQIRIYNWLQKNVQEAKNCSQNFSESCHLKDRRTMLRRLLRTSVSEFWSGLRVSDSNLSNAGLQSLCSSHGKSIYRSTVLLLGFGHFFSFLILYTVGRTLWMGDQPVARPLPTQNKTDRINAHRHSFLEWDSNPRSQRSSERIKFMP
jgi:hypothetical protein